MDRDCSSSGPPRQYEISLPRNHHCLSVEKCCEQRKWEVAITPTSQPSHSKLAIHIWTLTERHANPWHSLRWTATIASSATPEKSSCPTAAPASPPRYTPKIPISPRATPSAASSTPWSWSPGRRACIAASLARGVDGRAGSRARWGGGSSVDGRARSAVSTGVGGELFVRCERGGRSTVGFDRVYFFEGGGMRP